MKDYLVKALAFDDCVRIYAVSSTDGFNVKTRRNDYC